MLNVTKELTALARKLGYTGKAPDTVAKAINAITSVAGEGGGGNSLVVPIFTIDEMANVTCDMTFSQVNTAIKDGKCSYAKSDSEIIYQLSEYIEDTHILFGRFLITSEGVYNEIVIYNPDNSLVFNETHYPK